MKVAFLEQMSEKCEDWKLLENKPPGSAQILEQGVQRLMQPSVKNHSGNKEEQSQEFVSDFPSHGCNLDESPLQAYHVRYSRDCLDSHWGGVSREPR